MTMEDQVQSTEPRSRGDHVPAAARHRQLPGARRAAARVAEVPRQRRRAEDAVHVGRVARPRGRASVEAGLAVRLPRGADRRRRQLRRCTRSPTCRSSSPASAPTRSRRTTTPACTAGRQLKDHDGRCSRVPLPLPRLDLGARRRRCGSSRRTGTSSTSTDDDFSLPEAQGRHVGRLRVHQPRPRGRAARRVPRRHLPSSSSAGSSRTVTSRATSRRSCDANWKIAQEAFCESYHAPTTHPQTASYLGDVNSQIDIWDNFARVITPGGTPSPLLNGWIPTEDEILRYMLDIRDDEESYILLGDGQTAREVSAAAARERWRPVVGDMVDEWCDSEFIDNIDYTVFPNFHPWARLQPHRVPLPSRTATTTAKRSWTCILLAPFSGERPTGGHDHVPRSRRRMDRGLRTRACWPRCSPRTASTCRWSRRASRRRPSPA